MAVRWALMAARGEYFDAMLFGGMMESRRGVGKMGRKRRERASL